MPGLKQLKQFSSDVLNLGDELKVRATRSEKPAIAVLSPDTPDIDDSQDFVLGLPEEADAVPESDTGESGAVSEEIFPADSVAETAPSGGIPDLDEILNTAGTASTPDLSDFLESDKSEQKEPDIADMDLDELLKDDDKTAQPENSVETVPADESPVPVHTNDFDTNNQEIDMNSGLPEEVAESDAVPKAPDLGPGGDISAAASDFELEQEPPVVPQMPSSDDIYETPEVSDTGTNTSDGKTSEAENTVPPAESTSGLEEAEISSGQESQEAPEDSFDTSAMEGLDFGAEQVPAPPDSKSEEPLSDFNFPETDTKIGPENTDFELANPADFEIPGFSDSGEVPAGDKIQIPDFQGTQKTDTKQKKYNLTEAEYETFHKNLAEYPLNVRIAIEELIVKNEFTDDAVFEVINKVINKFSARQLASHLEKMLDITLNVPRDYERRSVTEYEAYKESLEYQLKNKVLPAILVAAGIALIGVCLFFVANRFIYRPLKAGGLYAEGYRLLESDEYPQADMKFNEALAYRASKGWFYRYARGYRAHKQYNRAEDMYMKILATFNFDKLAGLEYANMEMSDLANYERAETIDRRFVLDHYINDKDGLLLLGDIFLEWATEKDPSKFEQAREQYASLVQLYGPQDLYLSRMLRYFIRTDNLREVLQLKEHFLPRKKALGAQDLTELSGYLLQKEYGQLAPSDEYLRSLIEDVRTLLERAVKADPSNPVALYNMACYFIKVTNNTSAIVWLERTIDAFQKASVLKKDDVYKQIDSYRQLGELYDADREYVKAEEVYTNGISFFVQKKTDSGLEGNKTVGRLYGDMADLDYFITGDFDDSLKNYQEAIANDYDTPAIRYKVGVIQYSRNDYENALGAFIKTAESAHDDNHLLLAMANVLSMKNDNYAAEGYYENLLDHLDILKQRRNILLPQIRDDDTEIVDLYMKAANNLGVTLYRLARQTGDSKKNAEAMVRLSDSLRAWDALTRNQKTMVRLGGSNLAEQNMQYMSHPIPDYEPAIYADIPKTLSDDKGLK